MVLEYVPNTASVGHVDFRPFMIEVAWDYCQLVLESRHQRGHIEESLASLAIEIVLKSFNSAVVGNAGELNETYQFQVPPGVKLANKHNLVALAGLLRPDVRAYLFDPPDDEVLHKYQDTFGTSRYYYEESAPKVSTDAAMKLALQLICKTVYLYKQRGCTDPFVSAFDINSVFFTHVQRYLLVRGVA